MEIYTLSNMGKHPNSLKNIESKPLELRIMTSFSRVKDLFPDLYFDFRDYKTQHSKIKVYCSRHKHLFEISVANLTAGKYCKFCKSEKRANVQEQMELIHKGKYITKHVKLFDTMAKLAIICKIHGVFFMDFHSLKAGRGCQACGREKSGYHRSTFKDSPAQLYVVILSGIYYKVGITKHNLRLRYNSESLITVTPFISWFFEDGAIAFDLERKILRLTLHLKLITNTKILRGGGDSEIRTENPIKVIESCINELDSRPDYKKVEYHKTSTIRELNEIL